MSELQDRQLPIDQAIYAALISSIPGTWEMVKLVASSSKSNGSVSLSINIDSLNQTGLAVVSDELQNYVRQLFLLNDEFDTGLIGFVYTYSKRSNGKWSFVGDYDYG